MCLHFDYYYYEMPMYSGTLFADEYQFDYWLTVCLTTRNSYIRMVYIYMYTYSILIKIIIIILIIMPFNIPSSDHRTTLSRIKPEMN